MLTSIIVAALAVVSGSAPLAAARPITAAVLPLDAADVSSSDDSLAHVPLRQLQSQRQTSRAQRALQRRLRDQKARRERECRRSGKCGGSTGSTEVRTIVTVEEDEQEEVIVSSPVPPVPPVVPVAPAPPVPSTPKPRVFANRVSSSPIRAEPRPIPSPGDKKWEVCVSGDSQSFGPMDGRKPEGITVWANGRCKLEEYAGGFDGYWSVDAGDDHENGFAEAVKGMLRDNNARVGYAAGRDNPVNARVNAFMKELRDRADPLNMDFPRDAAMADGGMRMENINKASAVCSRMISVKQC